MLTKKDRQQLIADFKEVFATKDDLKELAKQKDLLEVKQKLDDLTTFSIDSIGNLLDWTNDIHTALIGKSKNSRREKTRINA